MRIAVIGGGAVGCLVAARLAAVAPETALVVRRPAAAAAIRRGGLSLTTPNGRVVRTPLTVTDDPVALGPRDAVLLCVKAHDLPGVLHHLSPLTGPDTVVVPILNGIPWWYPVDQPAPLSGRTLTSVDPGGVLSAAIDPDRVIGAVTHVAVERHGDDAIRHVKGERFVFGDPAGRSTPALSALVDVFGRAGFDAQATPVIRQAIWIKLWGNLCFNPISVLTGARMDALCHDPGTRQVAARMMTESRAVAERLGITLSASIDERIAMAAEIGAFKTSMLQDYEAGRRLELDAILGAVLELADRVGVEVPTLRTIHALTELRARSRAAS
ncbi:2-dehydropantoate 2-reductase [Roseospira marina]|uniref:2-dehydropantoate 2-reductase n=1 Tax=Roseospira marina TaxID=140057 RepID=A0A5M6IDP7_9PROT|nr:2-dehydropantoate 2-reductase [Roseospira marina]KAA5606410.1 2-dehydropantoate 2-reductase [Roseospira marina]MBB4314179.1 2-dehydropantoate 2-reductase [Roseospira marina]MBB5087340.1 2-dehydropantoate 2-reductase [Roseospira marina]